MKWLWAASAALWVFTAGGAAAAHTLAFGELRIRAADDGSVSTELRIDRAVDPRALEVSLGSGCKPRGASQWSREAEVLVARRSFDCPGQDGAAEVLLEGPAKADVQVVVTTVHADGSQTHGLLRGAEPKTKGSHSPLETLAAYVRLGFEHIAVGFDHLAFVLGLLLLSLRARAGAMGVLATISAFTIGHSITLALTVLGLASLRAAPVEALIAGSIVLVALELVRTARYPTVAQRRPWVVALGFGALHGFGFAGALREVGLPADALGTALFGFNLGVELGQVVFVSACAVVLAVVRRRNDVSPVETRWFGYALGGLASAWCIQRVVAIVS